MKRIVGILVVLSILGSLGNIRAFFEDKATLRDGLIRLHVVADSDSEEDQSVKLQVRDAVLSFVQENMPQGLNAEKAKCFLLDHLQTIEDTANDVLSACGSEDKAVASLLEEEFSVREYETFTLPSGVYESLRITIGSGEGRNWWCVVFPSLCAGASADDFQNIAVSSGLSESLTGTVSQRDGYEIRFFFLDCFGKLENLFHFG